ncbi:MAG: hypothetical protein PUJ21_07755 [Clostridia bacterium]|nr:hypothetical protein [Clostridia bacterium]MDY6185103.1 hypothetical protein [Eubacteriales bacterium]
MKRARRMVTGVAVGLLCGLLLLFLTSCGFTYAEGDLTDYMSLDPAALESLSVVLDAEWEVTDDEVTEAIRQLLFRHKSAVNGEAQELDTPIGEGDEVAFYLSLAGPTGTPISSGYEVGGGMPALIEYGSDTLKLAGLEDALAGVTPSTYALRLSGTIPTDGVLYLEYYVKVFMNHEVVREDHPTGLYRIPLSEVDDALIPGARDALVGQSVGTWQTVRVTGDEERGNYSEYSIRVRGYTPAELTFSTTWDGSPAVARLALLYMIDFSVPALTAQTVTETLEMCRDASDPVSALRETVRAVLEDEETRVTVLEEALLVALTGCFTFGELPKEKVKQAKQILKNDVQSFYDYCRENIADETEKELGAGVLDSFDTFVRAIYEVDDLSADEILYLAAQTQVREDLMIYYLARHCGFGITPETLAEGTDQLIASYLEDGDTERSLLKRYGGREYFEALCLRAAVLTALEDRVTILYQ